MSAGKRWALLSLGFAGTLAVGLVLGFDADAEASVLMLSIAGVVLLLSLRQMFAMVAALVEGNEGALARAASAAGDGSRSAQRQEQRRVLRAIKELDFDHAMGKLSAADHTAIMERYKLRAVELMRALDREGGLHPATVGLLEAGVASDAGLPAPGVCACPACDVENDADARFCKACGVRMEVEAP